MTDPTWPEPVTSQRVLGPEGSVERVDRWRWLASTRTLQSTAYGQTMPKEGEELADWVVMNHTALVKEVGEALDEVGWKPWATNRGWVNREAFIKELVDVGHFLANLLVAVGCTDAEWESLYRAKQEVNLRRQEQGYDGVAGKCHFCHRALDDLGVAERDNPRHPGQVQYVCAYCGAVQDIEMVKTWLEKTAEPAKPVATYGIRPHKEFTQQESDEMRRLALEAPMLTEIPEL